MTRFPHQRVHDSRTAAFRIVCAFDRIPAARRVAQLHFCDRARSHHRSLLIGRCGTEHPSWTTRQTYLITEPELRTSSGLVSLWVKPQTTKQYHPLVNTVFWVGNKLWGSSMLGYHLVNIFLHIVSALLLLENSPPASDCGSLVSGGHARAPSPNVSPGQQPPGSSALSGRGLRRSNISFDESPSERAARLGGRPQNAETPHSHN